MGLSQPRGPAAWGGGVGGGVGKSPAATRAFRWTGQPSLGPLFFLNSYKEVKFTHLEHGVVLPMFPPAISPLPSPTVTDILPVHMALPVLRGSRDGIMHRVVVV